MKVIFQPIPKRFMVWDKERNKFDRELLPNGNHKAIFDIWEMDWWLDRDLAEDNILVQSTNLFDKDDKEIFEGGIVEANWGLHTGSTYIDNSLVGVVKNMNGVWCIAIGKSDEEGKPLCELQQEELTLIGHILSNPELLERQE